MASQLVGAPRLRPQHADLVSLRFGEPDIAIRAGGDTNRCAWGWESKRRDRARWGDTPDSVGIREPEIAVRPRGNGVAPAEVRRVRNRELRNREQSDRACWGASANCTVTDVGEPEVAIRSSRDVERDDDVG